jgi:hypothetical protein
MPNFKKHTKSVTALIDVTEAMLNAMEKPDELSKKPEFTILIHFLKSIIDGELNIPNELTEKIRNKSEELGFDLEDVKKRLH